MQPSLTEGALPKVDTVSSPIKKKKNTKKPVSKPQATNNQNSETESGTLKKKKRNRNKNKKPQENSEKVENLLSKTFRAKAEETTSGSILNTDSTPAKSSQPNIEEKTVQNKVPMEKPHTEKNREEVRAAREAKKQSKQVKKSANEKTEVKLNVAKAKEVTEIEPAKNIETQKPLQNGPSSEKTREQIVAEREAKKLAKQLAKNKSKNLTEGTATVDNANNTEKNIKKSENQTAKHPIQKDVKSGPDITPENAVTDVANKLEDVKISDQSDQKKKPTTKAERRAIQEAQRATKAKMTEKQVSQKSQSSIKPDVKMNDASSKVTASENKKVEKSSITSSRQELKVKLFSHLEGKISEQNLFTNSQQIHPAIVKLGEQYAKRTVVGSNARCIAFLNALKTVIQDYETPPKKEFVRGLEASIKNCVNHLHNCRPLAVSVSNAHKHIKLVLTTLPTDAPETELKRELVDVIDKYIEDQIEKAAQAISSYVQEKISDGDVILTFGCSSLINHILEGAHNRHVNFRVIVVDSRPFLEGQELLRRLISKGIPCTCVLINAVGFIMPEVTKILLGAHALLANGYVMARTGTAQVALVGRSFNVPVLVCCETHKFSERVQTDAIVYNELGNPDDLIAKSRSKNCCLANWMDYKHLYPLNLNYDITPPELVTAVVTEVAILPCTSVPVILRIKPTEIGY